MVDAIKSTVNRLELTKGRASDSRPANAGAHHHLLLQSVTA